MLKLAGICIGLRLHHLRMIHVVDIDVIHILSHLLVHIIHVHLIHFHLRHVTESILLLQQGFYQSGVLLVLYYHSLLIWVTLVFDEMVALLDFASSLIHRAESWVHLVHLAVEKLLVLDHLLIGEDL